MKNPVEDNTKETEEGASDMPRVSIVDDDESLREAIRSLLRSVGIVADAFASAEEFLNSEHLRDVACLILDVRMPGMSGLELQAKLKAEGSRIPIIFITAHGDEKMKTAAMKAGALEFLSKPFDDEVLLEKVRPALKG